MKKRIFFGIKLSKDIVNKIINWRSNYKHLNVNWTHNNDLHLTIISPFYYPTDQIYKIVEKVEKQKNLFTPINLEFNEIVTFNKMIWLKAKRNESLEKIKDSLEETLQRYKEKRNFLPHVTLARINNTHTSPLHTSPFELRMTSQNTPLKRIVEYDEVEIEEKVEWQENIYHIDLLESKTTSPTKFYNVLKKFSF